MLEIITSMVEYLIIPKVYDLIHLQVLLFHNIHIYGKTNKTLEKENNIQVLLYIGFSTKNET